MFNKNTYIKIEFLPDGKFLLKSNIKKDTNPEPIYEFINGLLTRDLLEEFMKSLYENSKKYKSEEVVSNICEEVLNVQKNIQLRPIVSGRNPVIKPTNVMKQFSQGIENE